jgi:tetratricopeptide (TPR) repeat protein
MAHLKEWDRLHRMKAKRSGMLWLLMFCIASLVTATGQSVAEDPAALAATGQQAMARGDYVTAEEMFQKLAQTNPNIAEIHATLAAICFKRREYKRAISEIQTAEKLKPGLAKLDSLLGLSLAEEGQVCRGTAPSREGLPANDRYRRASNVRTRTSARLQQS